MAFDELPGFDLPDASNSSEWKDKAKPPKAKGGFQVMGLSFNVIKGITKRGYKIPTPVQRKTIPMILEGRNVVAMAKTGSGKTACFLIPLFEKLKARQGNTNARALILSPTRELAVQTFKFIKEIGKYMDLQTILVLGGDPINSQFQAMHTCPDIIVATPGRFLHLCVEMDLKLSSIEYVVFDEADRLFEMGFGEQLNETLNRLPESKQMVMFSATLPKMLVDFAKAGLNDPVLIRLDVDSKLPEKLSLKFVHIRPDERYSALISILKYIVNEGSQTVVFVATQHHVELVSYVLNQAKISNTFIYSSMDPSARKINTARFRLNKVSVLIVTDIAARGIDIPQLDYVVNVHFPGKPKLFVHRVGRCARAGRHGTAFSLVSTDDEAHLLDLYLFLNRTFDIKKTSEIGTVPPEVLEDEHEAVLRWLANQHISGVLNTATNAYKKYLSTRPVASADANKRVKAINFNMIPALHDFNEYLFGDKADEKKDALHVSLLTKMQSYRPSGTIFELNTHQNSTQSEVMKNKRREHGKLIEKFQEKSQQDEVVRHDLIDTMENLLPKSTDTEISSTFSKVVSERKRNIDQLYDNKKKMKKIKMKRLKKAKLAKSIRDTENYIPYHSSDKHTEEGLAINSFERQAQNAELSISTNTQDMHYKPGQKKWDRIKKKMVSVENPKAGKIRTESGIWIPATYKTGRYADWKEKTKTEDMVHQEMGLEAPKRTEEAITTQWKRHNLKEEIKKRAGGKTGEMKTTDQIVRERLRLELIKNREKVNKKVKDHNRKRSARQQKNKQRR
ncbi:ATP-dependent RNA helicase DDX54 [Sitodiplosis mosellana]|uniref:ATP-dependent RNA helicase DDX54 n=1 Tax=Sitodiplosis mosellana TaxID=263140 RepID=UPI0024449953|nr:ATP-dependent RNA helicase DDX54 [Sitodiplosis mosellana]